MAKAAKGTEAKRADGGARKSPSAKADLEDRIRHRAYELWEAAGRPHGQEQEHWARAERELKKAGPGPARARGAQPSAAGAASRPVAATKTGAAAGATKVRRTPPAGGEAGKKS